MNSNTAISSQSTMQSPKLVPVIMQRPSFQQMQQMQAVQSGSQMQTLHSTQQLQSMQPIRTVQPMQQMQPTPTVQPMHQMHPMQSVQTMYPMQGMFPGQVPSYMMRPTNIPSLGANPNRGATTPTNGGASPSGNLVPVVINKASFSHLLQTSQSPSQSANPVTVPSSVLASVPTPTKSLTVTQNPAIPSNASTTPSPATTTTQPTTQTTVAAERPKSATSVGKNLPVKAEDKVNRIFGNLLVDTIKNVAELEMNMVKNVKGLSTLCSQLNSCHRQTTPFSISSSTPFNGVQEEEKAKLFRAMLQTLANDLGKKSIPSVVPFYWKPAAINKHEFELLGEHQHIVKKVNDFESAGFVIPAAGSLRMYKGSVYRWGLRILHRNAARPQMQFGVDGENHEFPWRLITTTRCSRSTDGEPWVDRPGRDRSINVGDTIFVEVDLREKRNENNVGTLKFAVNDSEWEVAFEDIPLLESKALMPIISMGGAGGVVEIVPYVNQ